MSEEDSSKAVAELIKFKVPKPFQLMKEVPPQVVFTKTSYGEPHDLMYKVLKADVKLVRSMLESNNFVHTDGHDWNLLWTCSATKPYLYEGLNDY